MHLLRGNTSDYLMNRDTANTCNCPTWLACIFLFLLLISAVRHHVYKRQQQSEDRTKSLFFYVYWAHLILCFYFSFPFWLRPAAFTLCAFLHVFNSFVLTLPSHWKNPVFPWILPLHTSFIHLLDTFTLHPHLIICHFCFLLMVISVCWWISCLLWIKVPHGILDTVMEHAYAMADGSQ